MSLSTLPFFVFTKGVESYLDAGSEQTIFELESTNVKIMRGVFLDLNEMTQNGTIKVYHKIDGTNYRSFLVHQFAEATDPDGVFLDLNFAFTDYLKVTYEESVDEGADRTISYSIAYERRLA